MSAIVLDGQLKSALACVRSLGAQGITVTCGAERKSAMACHSKYSARRFVYTSPKASQEQFIKDVVAEAKRLSAIDGEKPVVFCFGDATVLSLTRAYDALQEYLVLPIPSRESVEIASDKERTYTCAKKLSIPSIATYSENEFGSVTFPCVVKNKHSIVWKEGESTSGSAEFVFSRQELMTMYQKIEATTGELPLVQEFINGDEYGVEMVCNSGEPLAVFVHKRIRSLSPRGGAGVIKETAREAEEVKLMQKYAEALVTELSWHGPVMVEFKIDTHSGRVLLMEINGRFWGSLPLAIKAGVDFPRVAYEVARGRAIESQKDFQPTYIRTRHFLGDCKWVLSVFFAKDRMRKYVYPSRLRALYDFKLEIFKSSGDIFVWNDLKPSIMEYVDLINKMLWRSKG